MLFIIHVVAPVSSHSNFSIEDPVISANPRVPKNGENSRVFSFHRRGPFWRIPL
jgi:hypothetical protein